MTTKQLFLPAIEVKKHNELIQNKVNLSSTIGQRILATLIANIDPNQDAAALTCKVHANEILKNHSGRSYTDLVIICSDMAKATVELEILGENGQENDFYFYPFFSRLVYKNGYISVKFNPELKDLLILAFKQGNFTKYNLLEFYMLNSLYSQRLYEILKSYSFYKEGEKTFSLQELHELLNTSESQRKNFGEFKRTVLEPAFKEIRKKTNFFYEYEPIKNGSGKTSPVVAIRFVFSKKRALPIAEKKIDENANKKADTNNLTWKNAWACWQKKENICKTQDNKKAICDVCLRLINNK